ncbi:glutamine synthetase III [Candidatus Akkermansia timonensis]|nr:glutamine synthetase III [Akkermansia sp.]MBT9562719.1 glutamine synthetase III [Candidatus Akkermansia timonensis]MBT9565302.1 glutamine synthetase III [Akkermansia muciniphila]MBT9600967.1 glutamine synthetase III [Akkermansia muciniphila]QWO87398.1 glutamine synthetase III [Candidatus Akkermansia timonensis]
MMSDSTRTQAISAIASVPAGTPGESAPVNIDYYGADVFSTEVMKKYLPKDTAKTLLSTIQDGLPLDADIAADVAHAMKQWAIERGATHYTHWFQPMTGSTAEKHDSFLDPKGMEPVMSFSGKNLIVSEPDASSFPSGGLRCTFEARGYTAWDPTSPAFIKRHGNGATLCIPTAYCSYTGDALDKKTPLLRSRQALGNATKRLMKCFNLPDAHVTITLGPEQEYFLIDKNFYLNRPDLVQTGRTLFGAPPAKHQQLEDHYFGSIKPRILNFMSDVEKELWRLGIPAKTRHNEVAPAQFELAPLFEDVNLAVDHNMLVMEILRQQANRHGLVCLLHEKPFAGVNGSGKHNNWSISYGEKNLLDPGNDPQQNAIFLTVLTAIIEAVDKHSDLLRNSVASAGNDHRLGANEAPPAIISIFLGDQLNEVIENIINGSSGCGRRDDTLKIGVDTLPILPRDATDRNRTSPFAFTGNKFEFRAPGSAQSCAGPMMTLNTIVAEAFDSLAEELSSFAPETFLSQLQETLKRRISEHKRIIFNGDNYSEEWVKEAEHRGLPNLKNTMTALHTLVNEKNLDLFEKYGVFSRRELESRFEIFLEEYHRRIRIEGRLSWEMAATIILPALRNEYKQTVSALSRALDAKQTIGTASLRKLADKLGDALDSIVTDLDTLETALTSCHEDILEAMSRLRTSVDAAETLVNDRSWPLPKYREMLFIY